MKQNSIDANEKAEEFKEPHRIKIWNALTESLTNKEIALKTGLSYHAVARRTPEMEKTFEIRDIGTRNRCTIYERVTQLTIEDTKVDYSHKTMLKHAKGLLYHSHLLQAEMIVQLEKLKGVL